jgi:hypothetical protein
MTEHATSKPFPEIADEPARLKAVIDSTYVTQCELEGQIDDVVNKRREAERKLAELEGFKADGR